jgi:prepilin-type N-terminal cleavage/methylation domain-containing protein
MINRNRNSRRAAGFTLIEILVALALVTGLTLLMFQTLAPWLNLRQKIDTERRLDQIKSAIVTTYRTNAMGIEARSDATLQLSVGGATQLVTPSPIIGSDPNRSCDQNPQAALALGLFLTDDPQRSLNDGSKQPLCLHISARQTQVREGVTLHYHVIAVVAQGNDGRLGSGTVFDAATGRLTVDPASDDSGILVNGFAIQHELYLETRRRIDRVASLYGSYFTARYLGNPARDYSIDYFVGAAAPYDADAGVNGPLPTGALWQPVSTHLAALGLGPEEQTSVYESANLIEVANQKLDAGQLTAGTPQVQEPATKGIALPPYTALLRTALPGGTHLIRVVPGNY